MTYVQLTVGPLATHCYIVADENGAAAVIDPGDNASAITRLLSEKGYVLSAVLLTHAHFDHIGAVSELIGSADVPLYCHRADIAALSDARRNLSAFFGAPLAPLTGATAIDEGDAVTVGSLTFTVLHTPGHTPGSVCYRIEDHLFSGDTLFCESVGRIDFPGGDGRAMRQSLSRLLALEGDAHVHPGHDEETTLSHERQYNPYIA